MRHRIIVIRRHQHLQHRRLPHLRRHQRRLLRILLELQIRHAIVVTIQQRAQQRHHPIRRHMMRHRIDRILHREHHRHQHGLEIVVIRIDVRRRDIHLRRRQILVDRDELDLQIQGDGHEQGVTVNPALDVLAVQRRGNILEEAHDWDPSLNRRQPNARTPAAARPPS